MKAQTNIKFIYYLINSLYSNQYHTKRRILMQKMDSTPGPKFKNHKGVLKSFGPSFASCNSVPIDEFILHILHSLAALTVVISLVW